MPTFRDRPVEQGNIDRTRILSRQFLLSQKTQRPKKESDRSYFKKDLPEEADKGVFLPDFRKHFEIPSRNHRAKLQEKVRKSLANSQIIPL